MSTDYPLPSEPGVLALLKYKLAASNWRFVQHAAFTFGLIAIAAILAWTAGTWTKPWIVVKEPVTALPREHWPVMSDAEKPLVMADDGNPATLSMQDVRNRLADIHANVRTSIDGGKPIDVASEPVVATPGTDTDTVALSEYAAWVSSEACSTGGWQVESREQVAALVRNGVWGCSGFKRSLAGWPLPIRFGLLLGFPITLALWAMLAAIGWFLIRRIIRTERDFALHRKLFRSWAA